LPAAVSFVKGLDRLLPAPQLAVGGDNPSFGELTALAGLGLALLGVEVIEVLYDTVGHGGGERGVLTVDAHANDAGLVVHADRDELVQLLDAASQAVCRITSLGPEHPEQCRGVRHIPSGARVGVPSGQD